MTDRRGEVSDEASDMAVTPGFHHIEQSKRNTQPPNFQSRHAQLYLFPARFDTFLLLHEVVLTFRPHQIQKSDAVP